MPKSERLKQTKRTAFAKEYVSNGFNGTAAYKEINKGVTRGSAGVEATRMLKDIKTLEAISQELDRAGLTNEYLDNRLKELSSQNKQLAVALGSVQEANKLKSRYPKDKEPTKHLHLHLTDSELDVAIQEKLDELHRINTA